MSAPDTPDASGNGESLQRVSLVRTLLATAGLVVLGMVCGGLTGLLAFAIALARQSRWYLIGEPVTWLFGGGVGAFMGGLFGPVAAWLCFRRVPLGKGILYATAASAGGAALGSFLVPDFPQLAVALAMVGLFSTAAHLYLTGPRPDGGGS